MGAAGGGVLLILAAETMRDTWILIFIIAATFAGWALFELLQKKMRPRQSARRGILFLLTALLFILLYSAAIIFGVRLIFGKPL